MKHSKQGRKIMTNEHSTTTSSGRSAERGTTYCGRRLIGSIVLLVSIFALATVELMAQVTPPVTPTPGAGASPWLNAIAVLQAAFTGPIARGLSLIAVVVGGLMFAFGEGGSKKALAGIIFGLGMAMGAANFLAWLF